jgi:hypothetical protein
MDEVSKVFAGMMAETLFRDSPLANLDSYMKIRTRTIGMAPFLVLADESAASAAEVSEELKELKECFSETIGLQNELIGLDKDLKVEETMNVVVVLGGLRRQLSDSADGEAEVLRDCAREAERMHSSAVERAVELWRKFRRRARGVRWS